MKRINHVMQARMIRLVRTGLLAAATVALALHATTAAAAQIPISNSPLFLGGGVDPRIMLNLSNDHQLYFKAFDDYSDLDGDGAADTTYDHTIDYYGYFDPDKCYTYQNNRFEPQAFTTDKYCNGVSGDWSGNFLNWATMTRIDVVRKILYGGSRSVDSSTETVLERTYLPNDAHSFAKYYNDTDINKLTPFNGISTGTTSSDGITICNTTRTNTQWSQDVTDPPLMRVAEGNYALWASNERWQCLWSGEESASNGNDPAESGIPAHGSNPDESTDGLGDADYNVRVQVCVDDGTTDLINNGQTGDDNDENNENCVVYPDGNYKPIGLLQEYGDDESILFGLMTGSYGRNKSGGVLRKNTISFSNEVNVDTDGSFKAQPADGGIIGTLEAFRIFGYDHTDGRYNNNGSGNGDDCPWGLSSFNDGQCTNWGNPQTELFLESLRYFAGASASAAYNTDDSNYISALKTPSWEDPIADSGEYCAPLRTLQFNASTSSYDGDELGGVTDINMSGTGDLDAETNAVGTGEGISGNEYFVGETAGDTNQLCTAKTINDLAEVAGTCPNAPRLEGTYQIAGLAKYAHLSDIRSDRDEEQTVDTFGVSLQPAVPRVSIPVPGSTDTVTILPACRNTDFNPDANCAIVDFKIAEQDVAAGTGKLYVNWEDSEQGGDFDSDMWGVIEYKIDTGTNTISVSTDVIDESTVYDMGFGYVISGTTADGFHAHSGIEGFDYTDTTYVDGCSDCQVGDAASTETYTLGGSSAGNLEAPLYYAAKWGGFEDLDDDGTPNQQQEWDLSGDGSPDNYFFAQDPGALAESLSNAFLGVTERESSSAAVALNSQSFSTDSRLYQARFNSEDWSGQLLAFEIESTPSPDGQRLLLSVADTPSWDASDLLDNDSPSSRRIIAGREPASSGDPNGVPFTWPADPANPTADELSASQVAALNLNPEDNSNDGLGEERLEYLRGDRSNESAAGFRVRGSVLGDLINSAPVFVGAPRFLYPDDWDDFTVAGNESMPEDNNPYSQFFLANDEPTERKEVVYVGGNDGMVHAFDAATGDELLAFVPSEIFSSLSELTSPNYEHRYFVDGSPTYADAYFDDQGASNGWRSVLTGGLNAGGQGVYALDITDPNNQFVESQADDLVLWEFTDEDDADMGYSFSKPNIVRMKNGEWAAVFGNGYNNTDNQPGDTNVGDGTAALYVVDIESGALIRKIDTNEGSSSSPNGLSSVAPVDVDGDFIIDRAYAGDLEGNLWRFDLSDSDPANWDYVKVFETEAEDPDNPSQTVTQPITVRPQVGPHPAGQDGYMVYFGTGKYIGSIDTETVDVPTQTFYAVLDVSKSNGQQIVFDKDDLLQQTIVQEVVVDANNTPSDPNDDSELRITSDNEIPDWFDPDGSGSQPSAVGGWYMDLLNTDNGNNTNNYGEKAVTDPLLRSGRIIFTTLIPSESPCDFGGDGWLMEIDAEDGGLLGIPPFDLNDDVTFDGDDTYNDQSPGGIKSDVGIIPVPAIMLTPGNTEAKFMSGSTGDIQSVTESSGDEDRGRQSWEELR